jgi:hypothetical protein
MNVGDRVRLDAELSLCDNGETVYRGHTGMVVGGSGLEGVVVAWDPRDTPDILYSVPSERMLSVVNRIPAQRSPRTTPVR